MPQPPQRNSTTPISRGGSAVSPDEIAVHDRSLTPQRPLPSLDEDDLDSKAVTPLLKGLSTQTGEAHVAIETSKRKAAEEQTAQLQAHLEQAVASKQKTEADLATTAIAMTSLLNQKFAVEEELKAVKQKCEHLLQRCLLKRHLLTILPSSSSSLLLPPPPRPRPPRPPPRPRPPRPPPLPPPPVCAQSFDKLFGPPLFQHPLHHHPFHHSPPTHTLDRK